MLAYDTASSSSSSSSPPPLRQRLRRAHVPRPYSPSSREADIARLLDPAYASPAHNSPLIKSRKEVYVDHQGDLHDPDFRDFPPFTPSHTHPRRPRWECGYRDDDAMDDEECDPEPRRPSLDLPRRRPSSSITFHPPPFFYPYEDPASYESRFLAEDEDEDEPDQFERTPLKEKSFYCRSRSPAKRPQSQDEKVSDRQVISADSEWTPTCTQNLRRHWQAFTLSLRFTLFRTKRRLRRRLTG